MKSAGQQAGRTNRAGAPAASASASASATPPASSGNVPDPATVTVLPGDEVARKRAGYLCGGFMGSQARPPIAGNTACESKVIDSYRRETANMSPSERRIFNDAYAMMTQQVMYGLCFNAQAKGNIPQRMTRNDIEALNKCTIDFVMHPGAQRPTIPFAHEVDALDFESYVAYAANRARGLVGVDSAEKLAIPQNLQKLIDDVKAGRDTSKDRTPGPDFSKLAEPERDALARDLNRHFRQAASLVPRDRRVKASYPIADQIVADMLPRLDEATKNAGDKRQAAIDKVLYRIPVDVNSNPDAKNPVTWREGASAAAALPANTTPAVRRAILRLYAQGVPVYAAQGGTKPDTVKSLVDAIEGAIKNQKIPDDQLDFYSLDPSSVKVENNDVAPGVRLTIDQQAPAGLVAGNDGIHEFERNRALNLLWVRTLALVKDRPNLLAKVVADLRAKTEGKHTYQIHGMLPTAVDANGAVAIHNVPLQTLLDSFPEANLLTASADTASTEMGGLETFVDLYSQALALKASGQHPALNGLSNEALATKVNVLSKKVLRDNKAHPRPDAWKFLGVQITGVDPQGNFTYVITNPPGTEGVTGNGGGDGIEGLIAGNKASFWSGKANSEFTGIKWINSPGYMWGLGLDLNVGHHESANKREYGIDFGTFVFHRDAYLNRERGSAVNVMPDDGSVTLFRIATLMPYVKIPAGDHLISIHGGFGSSKPMFDASTVGLDSHYNFPGGFNWIYSGTSTFYGLRPRVALNFGMQNDPFKKEDDPTQPGQKRPVQSPAFQVNLSPGVGTNGTLLNYDSHLGRVDTAMGGFRYMLDLGLTYDPLMSRGQSLPIKASASYQGASGELAGNNIAGNAYLFGLGVQYRPVKEATIGLGARYGTKTPEQGSPMSMFGVGLDGGYTFKLSDHIKLTPGAYVGYQNLSQDRAVATPGVECRPGMDCTNGIVADRVVGSSLFVQGDAPTAISQYGSTVYGGFRVLGNFGPVNAGLHFFYMSNQNKQKDESTSTQGNNGGVGITLGGNIGE